MTSENKIGSGREGFIAVAVIIIVALLIIPVPVLLLDILIGLNLLIALLVLFRTLYNMNTKDLSLFPMMLLIFTIYNLVVNISAARLILTKGADFDGRLIRFVSSLVSGSGEIVPLVVGFAIFIAITAIHALIIIKGTARVAEIAARFTLDGLPTKQMAIDAEYSSGTIVQSEATARKESLIRESDFFGALDGAGKFMSGNAKVGIAVTGGIVIAGTLIDHLLRDYSIIDGIKNHVPLAIGSGILFMIPTGLIAVAVGIVVTREA